MIPKIDSVEDFQDALAKGLGRTMLAIREPGGGERYSRPLIEGCVRNLIFDQQLEEGRAPYLMRLLNAAGLRERALDAVCEALPDCLDGWDRYQMLGLLSIFAQEGEERAWSALEREAERGEEQAQDALARSGPQGLEWGLEHVVPNLPEEETWRIGGWLPEEGSGEPTETERKLRGLYKAWKARIDADPGRAQEPRRPPQQFLNEFERGFSSRQARSFVDTASNTELKDFAERFFLLEPARPILRAYEFVFGLRPFPLPPDRLFELAEDAAKGRAARRMLGGMDDPEVRSFALDLFNRRPVFWEALEIIRSSAEPTDGETIASLLPLAAVIEPNRLHRLVMGLLEWLGADPAPFEQSLADWIYENSPCSFCRGSALRWMVEHGNVSAGIRDEASFDAETETRALVSSRLP